MPESIPGEYRRFAGERYLSKVIVMKCTPAPKDFRVGRGSAGFTNLFGFADVAGRASGPGALALAEHCHELLALHTAQPEQQKRIAVELLGQQVVDRGDVFAWVGEIGAVAGGDQITSHCEPIAARTKQSRSATSHRIVHCEAETG
jgi:hypothetical protein